MRADRDYEHSLHYFVYEILTTSQFCNDIAQWINKFIQKISECSLLGHMDSKQLWQRQNYVGLSVRFFIKGGDNLCNLAVVLQHEPWQLEDNIWNVSK